MAADYRQCVIVSILHFATVVEWHASASETPQLAFGRYRRRCILAVSPNWNDCG
jgi:hypothetical protein